MRRIHRGWFILGLTILNLFACLGLGRFSLGAILPFMKDGLELNYREAGLIASAVFLGYLISAFFVGHFVARFSAKRVIVTALCITLIGMLISSISTDWVTAYLAFFIIGLGSGGANVPSLGMVSRWFAIKYRGMALGITNSGSGFGMVASGFVVPLLMLIHPDAGWRISWGVLAAAVLVIILLNIFLLVDEPEQVGLRPVGDGEQPASQTAQNSTNVKPLIDNVYRSKLVLLIGIIYFAWGFSYLIFSTFFVDFLIQDAALEAETAGKFFASAGIASIVSGFAWGHLSDKIGRMLALSIIYCSQAILLTAFALTEAPGLIYLETLLYALTLWGVPTVIVAAVSDLTVVHKASVAIGFITLFFGVGQWVSPMITGALLDMTSSYTIAFYLSAAVSFAGGLGCIYVHLKQSRAVAPSSQTQGV